MKDKIDRFIGTLAELSSFLVEVKYKLESSNLLSTKKVVEKYLNDFNFSSTAPMRRPEALKLNSELLSRGCFTQKELNDMPNLKDLKYRYHNGVHEFRYRRNGYNEHFCSKYYDVAKENARKFIYGLKKIVSTDAERQRGQTLDSVFVSWIQVKRAHTEKTSWLAYENVYMNHISPKFGKRAVKNILPIDLQPFFDELHEKYGRTCENARTVLNAVFKFAVANRFCQSNPMPGVVVERHVRTPGKALTDEQIKRFNVQMAKRGKLGLAYLIILYSGVRGAELHSITFDWPNGTFTVDNAKLKKSQKVNPGNLKRTVPIFPGLYRLRERIENEEWRVSPTHVTTRFSEYWTENTAKDLRHTFSTKAREAGVDNELVNIWMGHSAGKNLTANTYTHFSIEFQKKHAKKISNY